MKNEKLRCFAGGETIGFVALYATPSFFIHHSSFFI